MNIQVSVPLQDRKLSNGTGRKSVRSLLLPLKQSGIGEVCSENDIPSRLVKEQDLRSGDELTGY